MDRNDGPERSKEPLQEGLLHAPYSTEEDEETNSSTKHNGDVTSTHNQCHTLEIEESISTKSDKTTKEDLLQIPQDKIQKRSLSSGEINNVDNIQPPFRELSLHSPTSHNHKVTNKYEPASRVRSLKFHIETACAIRDGQAEIINLACEPIFESSSPPTIDEVEHGLDSSGNLADVSRTISTLSDSPISYVPPPATHLKRISLISSSSASSLASSAAALASQKKLKNLKKLDNLNESRISYLIKKWKNSNLVYGLLDCIDKIMSDDCDGDKENCIENKLSSALNLNKAPKTTNASRKRHPSPESRETPNKRLKPSPPPVSLGAEIFAKWQNRKYYFAHVTEIIDDNHVKVVFLDNTVRTVSRDQLINDLNSLIGHKVMVTNDTDEEQYYPGIVTNFSDSDGVFKYLVLTDSGDFEVKVNQMYFTEPQAKSIKQGRILPKSQTNSSKSDTDSVSVGYNPSCSGIQKEMVDTGSETDGSTSKTSSDLDSQKHIMGCDLETKDPQNLSSSVKLKTVKGKVPKWSNKHEDSLLGPVKHKGSWFKGLYFMVTCSMRNPTSSTEDAETDSEDCLFTRVPFVSDRLIQQIKLGGGEVFDRFEDIHSSKHSNTYLVTNRPCLTPKYLECLAAGITSVCHEWIVNCTVKQHRQPIMTLPAGWSLEKSKFIESFDRKSQQPLCGLRIKLAQLANRNFHRFWSHICNIVGADVSAFTGTFENTNVIVAENGLKDTLLDKATAVGIPVVSASWIIQSIIHGEARPYDGHPSYNQLYEETEEF